jgi:hypothetical protein
LPTNFNNKGLNFSNLKNLKKRISNLPGWRTTRKIIVFESDDWGSIRMPSLETFKKLNKAGLNLHDADALRYNLNDSFATSSDLANLYEVLSGYKDRLTSNPVFTAVSVVANPDFKRIREADFNEYFYEPFTETLKKYPGCENSFELWREGIEKKLFIPQMHGREHLNVSVWMRALKDGDKSTQLAFNEGFWGFVPDTYPETDYQAAFLLNNPEDLEYQQKTLIDGLRLFNRLFGYKAEYFVPPNMSFNNRLNKVLIDNGIKYRAATNRQIEPMGNTKKRNSFHWMGQKDKSGIIYMIRNCRFEPNQSGKNWVDSCMNDIKIAFNCKKPAVINTHRVNYIGSLNLINRDNGLRQLEKLLSAILKNWPDVTFMTTPTLCGLIN